MRTRYVAALLPLLFVATCSKHPTAATATDTPSETVPAVPTTVDEMLVTARSFANKCTVLELTGPLEKYRGSLDQKALYQTLETETDIKELTSEAKDPAAMDFASTPAYGMSCPNGRFVVYQQVRKATRQNWLVGVNLDAKKAAVMYFQNTAFEQAGDISTLAAMWAYRGLGIQDYFATGMLRTPPASPSLQRRQMAVGYLYGVQAARKDIVRANASLPHGDQPNGAQLGAADTPSDRLAYSGDYLSYPKGSTEAQLRERFSDLNCYRMNGATDDVCVAKTSLTSTTIIQRLPNNGSCLVGKEFNVTMDGGKVSGVSCDIAKATADAIAADLAGRVGAAKREQRSISSMQTEHFEWKIGQDYVLLTHYTGQDMRGNPLNSFNLSVGTQPLKLAP